MWRTKNSLLEALAFADRHQRVLETEGIDGNGYYEPGGTKEEREMASTLIATIRAALAIAKKMEG